VAETLFLVERYLPGADIDALAGLRVRLQAAAAEMREEGRAIVWLQSVVVPSDDTCLCLFRSPYRAYVVEANSRAAADWERISAVLAAGEL
jgi:hypothetical protein